jgi:nitroreductase
MVVTDKLIDHSVLLHHKAIAMAKDIIESLKWRYATKKFDSTKKLSPEKLDILKRSFDLTATSYGLQPLKMVIVSGQENLDQLVPLSYNQPQIGNASHILVICIESEVDTQYIRDYFNSVQRIRKTSRDILKPFEDYLVKDFSEKELEEIRLWATKQAYLALGNLITVCAVEEIDACPIEGFEPEKYDEFLKLNEMGLRSVLVLAVGYRAKDDMFSGFKKVRRGVDKVIIEHK